MKKYYLLLLIGFLTIMMPMNVSAGSVNAAEASLIAIAGETYEKNGAYWKLKDEYLQQGIALVNRDDIDVTEEQAAELAAKFYATIGDPTYFDKVGEVETEPTPGTDPGSTQDPPAEEPTELVESSQPESAEPSVSESRGPVEEPTKPSESETTEESTEREQPEQTGEDEASRESEESSLQESTAGATETAGTDEETEQEATKPGKDYSNAAPLRDNISFEVALFSIVGIVAAVLLAVIIRSKSKRRK